MYQYLHYISIKKMMVNWSLEFEMNHTFEKFITGFPPFPKKTFKKLRGITLIVSSLQ